jgi:hypothetical protein
LTIEATAQSVAAQLAVEERLLLFCVASETDWTRAGITGATASNMILKDLLGHDRKNGRLVLTLRGREVLAALLDRAGVKLAALN